MDLVVDIQCQLLALKSRDRISLALASTLDLDGKPDKNVYDQSGDTTLLDKFDYGMHGKVFKYELEGESKISM